MVVDRCASFKNLISKKHIAYKCPKCGHTSDQAGNRPDCNVEMAEEKEEAAA